MQNAVSREKVVKIYDRWAPVYDKVFGTIFEQARRSAIDAGERVGGRVLEVGVGTGISLPYYSSRCRVVGIDISENMLQVARDRVSRQGLVHVEGLHMMDAQNLDFEDGSFDVVTAQYVVNTVPQPEAALAEFARVLKPGGELIIINRVGAEAGVRYKVEHALQPIAQKLGWQSEFPWHRFERWLAVTPQMHLIERRPMPPFRHFALIRFGKRAAAYEQAGTAASRLAQ